MSRINLLISLLLCLNLAFGQQNERIICFHSDIKIDTEGRSEVTEHIKVYAAGNEIKRGIVRELPLSCKDNKGRLLRVNYDVLSVKCNGDITKYNIKKESGKLAIYIGDKDVHLNPGEYEYTIIYESYGLIGLYEEFDELYWNVTGNEWDYPIMQASASITLPDNAIAKSTDFYTGLSGSKNKNCTVEDQGNVQIFTTTQRLAPHENLSVVVAFPRDIISRPPPPTGLIALWNDYSKEISLFIVLLICLCYFLISYRKAGKYIDKPAIIPTFTPPRNMSPASVNYIFTNGYKNAAFTATFVEMAVKGAINICCENESTSSKKMKYSLFNKMNTEKLLPEEREIHDAVFKGKETIEINKNNSKNFYNAGTILRKTMEKQWNLKDYFRENRGHIALGGFLLILIFALYVFVTGVSDEVVFALMLASPFVALVVAFLFSSGLDSEIGCQSYIAGFFVSFLLIGYVWVEVCEENISAGIHWLSAGFFVVMSLLYIVYSKSIKTTFTAEGVKIIAELKGFKMYMKTAEEHRLNILNPPERTPKLFEKLLPYAIALGVSNEWCKKFNDVLNKVNYNPEWYNSGKNMHTMRFEKTFSTMGTSLSSSIASSVRSSAGRISSSGRSSGSSSWSSGSGGRGYSGGGRGGGGGRGW